MLRDLLYLIPAAFVGLLLPLLRPRPQPYIAIIIEPPQRNEKPPSPDTP